MDYPSSLHFDWNASYEWSSDNCCQKGKYYEPQMNWEKFELDQQSTDLVQLAVALRKSQITVIIIYCFWNSKTGEDSVFLDRNVAFGIRHVKNVSIRPRR